MTDINHEAAAATTSAPEAIAAPIVDSRPAHWDNEPSLKDFKSQADLEKSYKELKSFLGTSIRIPGADAADEDRSKFLEKLATVPGIVRIPDEADEAGMAVLKSKLGVPESADGYKYTLPEGFDAPEAEDMAKFNDYAFKLGLTNAQANKLLRQEMEELSSAKTTMTETTKAGEEKMKAMWGAAYDDKIRQANTALLALKDKFADDVSSLATSGAMSNPAMLTMLSELGAQLTERASGGIAIRASAPTPMEAAAQMQEIFDNPKHPYHDAGHRDHITAVEKVTELMNQRHQ